MDNLTAGNPLAHRVRVYYDGSSTIAEGMPVCYNYLTTQNWYGGSVNDAGEVTASEITAEGSHNKGKYLYVSNPICCNSTTGTWSQSAKTIDDDGDELDNLQVNMMVSVASATDSDIDGNWRITAVNATDNTITLGDMAAAEAAAITDAIADCTVKIDNIHAFAGVVAKGGWVGKTGPQVLDIYVPNGAIVPVLTVLASTTAGRTILSVVSATQTLGNPTTDSPNYGGTAGQIDSKPVAIAAETITSAGLVLAKLDDSLFLHGGGQLDHEFNVGYAGTVNTSVNKMFLNFTQTDGYCQALHYRTKLSGTGGGASRGVYRFETFVTGATGEQTIGLNIMLDLTAGGTGGQYFTPLQIQMRSRSSDPDLSSDHLYAIMVDWNLTDEGGASGTMTNPPHQSAILYINTDSTGSQPKNFMQVERLVGIGAYTGTAGVAPAAGDVMIPVSIQNSQYYLVAFADPDIT